MSAGRMEGGGCAVRVHWHDRQGGSSPCVNQQQARAQGRTQHKKVQDGEGGGGGGLRPQKICRKNYTSCGFYGCVSANDRAGTSHPVGTFGEGKRENQTRKG